jgi:hypothetical protein
MSARDVILVTGGRARAANDALSDALSVACPSCSAAIGVHCLNATWRARQLGVANVSAFSKMTETEKAWLACAVDGEGYICVFDKVEERTGWKYRKVQLGVTNTDLNFLAEAGRLIGNTKLYGGGKLRVGRKKVCYQVRQVDRFKAAAILKEIFPYLIIKKDKAAAGIRLVEGTDWSRKYSDEVIKQRQEKTQALWDSGAFTGARGKRWKKRKPL